MRNPGHDRSNASAAAAQASTRCSQPEQKHGLHDPIEMQKAGAELSTEQVSSRWIVASDPEQAIAQITPYLDCGFNHLVFHAPGHDQYRFLTQFSEQLLPRLREL